MVQSVYVAVLNQYVESYVAMAVEVYRVMFVNQVAVSQCHIILLGY